MRCRAGCAARSPRARDRRRRAARGRRRRRSASLGPPRRTRTRSTDSATTPSTSRSTSSVSVSGDCSRPRSMMSCTSSDSRDASVRICSLNRRTVAGLAGGVGDGLRQQRQGPDRRLQLVGDVRHEVPAHLLEPTLRRRVLGEHEHAVAGQRCRDDVERQPVRARQPRSRDRDAAPAGTAGPPHLSDEIGDLGRRDPAVADQTLGVRVGADAQHLLARSEQHGRRGERREQRRDVVVDRWRRGRDRCVALRPLAVEERADTGCADGQPDQGHHDEQPVLLHVAPA